MYLTEIYAKRKWCHRTFPNTGPSSDAPFNCEASECMAWRWGDPATKQETVATIPQIKAEFGVDVDRAEVRQVPFGPERRGFCGLAGQPEVE
jgi:hypothetical protein